MPELARKITYDPGSGRVLVNGEEFPYYLHADGISVSSSNRDTTIVSLPLLVEEVEILTWKKRRDDA